MRTLCTMVRHGPWVIVIEPGRVRVMSYAAFLVLMLR